jgi:adenine-specific DNA-methyltransferase
MENVLYMLCNKLEIINNIGKNEGNNIIIKGDNKKVLPLIFDKYQNKVKCIYIDPPYNNNESYNHYEDNESHEKWLESMSNVLILLKDFLSEEGSIWISIDDNEMHYLKVVADSIFGRSSFITTIIWQQRNTRENRKVFSNNHEYILVYAKNPDKFKKIRNSLPITKEALKRYKNPDNDPRGPWQSVSLNVQAGHATPNQFYGIVSPTGKIHFPPNGRCWIHNEKKIIDEISKNNIWFGKDGNGVPRRKKFFIDNGLTPETLWMGNEVGTNKSAKKHILELFPTRPVFDTPKPEQLIKRILDIATNENDIVLDCFLGSGTTTAVAHKLNRRYIGIEASQAAIELVLERMKRVINGEKGGISEEVQWKGGGGLQFYSLV